MNALIVDDERLARSELRRLLQLHDDMRLVREAANADEAVARLSELQVDILFLDIKMPGGSGFDLLERLDTIPPLIFTTAYDEFAVRAFEVNAFDYLLKPIRPERLAAALDKARAASKPARPAPERIFVREGDRCWIVAVTDVALFESDGNYTRVYFGSHRPLIRSSLNALEARLDASAFFRASRNHIVNLRFVESVEGGVDDSYTLRLRSGQTVAVSRRQSQRLRETLRL